MIKLAEAQATNFQNSTRAELRKYAEELGLDNIPDNANSATLKRHVMGALGMAQDSGGAPSTQRPVVERTKSPIFPSYNLTPDGIWGGRRHRLSIPRPEGSKDAAAEGFAWNGKHTYYLPYDEVTDVPEPIYHIIIQNKRRRPTQKQTVLPGGATEVTTAWEFDNAPMTYLGVDKVTEKRAGSLMEWYQSRGTAFFEQLDLANLSKIARLVGVPVVESFGPGIPAKPYDADGLRAKLFEFFFSYADAKVEPNKDIEP